MSVVERWQSGKPCTDCGCDAYMNTDAGRLHAHLADCPRLDVNRLTNRIAVLTAALDMAADDAKFMVEQYVAMAKRKLAFDEVRDA
jgi:hypothetical protein